jgi:hypothetical protein
MIQMKMGDEEEINLVSFDHIHKGEGIHARKTCANKGKLVFGTFLIMTFTFTSILNTEGTLEMKLDRRAFQVKLVPG